MTMADPEKTEVHRRARGFVPLERYAEILAHAVHFGSERLPELLQRFGLSPDQWTVVDEAWTHELAEGKRRQQHEQAARFNVSFTQTRQRLATTQPRMDKVGT
jgi:sarcosine oxidase gamma subunit